MKKLLLPATLLAGWLLVSLSQAAAQSGELAGTYAFDGPEGRVIVRIEVVAGRLAGAIQAPGTPTILLSGNASGQYARGRATVGSDTGEFEALVEGDVLALQLSERGKALPVFRLQRVRAGAAAAPRPQQGTSADAGPPSPDQGGDPRLVGTWTRQTLIRSGDSSMAIEHFLVFRADGSYSSGTGRAVAGGIDWHQEGGGGPVEHGRWRAQDGIFFVRQPNGQWGRVGRYGMTDDRQTMRITYDGGGKQLWSRR